ncbi:DUF7537 family lipoprotein [Natronomonas marina]|uniref:DUF7537 family lipoprotein n=1 Tax=Natronomonas marina TaxID=2961939 RepID=UPI0020C94640|nr:hypothetical protein [Natronomonas marina]
MVKRSTLAVSLVVVLTLLSGCSAVLDGGGNGNATDGDGPSDPAGFEYADGYGPDGVTDGSVAVESHQSSLIDGGSFTGTYTYEVEANNETTAVNVESRVDFESEENYQRVDVDTPQSTSVVEVYRNSDTRYRRSEFNNQSSVQSQDRTFVAENVTALDPVRPLLLNISAYDSSVVERNGTTVVVYEKTSSEGVDSFYGVQDSANISSFSGTMAVDSDGVVRSADYEMTYTVDGQQRTLSVEYSLSAVGDTSVERPAWVDEA